RPKRAGTVARRIHCDARNGYARRKNQKTKQPTGIGGQQSRNTMKSGNIRNVFLLLFLSFSSVAVLAQNREIRGTLKTADGKPVAHASVMIKNQQQRVLAFNASDSQGTFLLTWPDTAEIIGLRVEINHLGYKKVSIPLIADRERYEIPME